LKKNKTNNSNKNLPYNYIWSIEKPNSFITESYQKFLANFEYLNIDKKYKVIQISSSVSGEGKSTILANIAHLLSEKGYKTLLIDLDLRKPKVHRIFNLESTNGLTDILTNKVSLEDALKKTKKSKCHIITCGEKTNTFTSILESEKLNLLLSNLKSKYDYILLDSPPVINVSDALYISRYSDGILFVVSQKQSKIGFAKEAVNLLRQNKVNILGAIMSKVDIGKRSYGYYGYGYSYNYEYDSKDD
jgi:capsular exopolysaccharide synthesis family protein